MVMMSSTMIDIGTGAADFNLPDPASSKHYQLADFAGKPLLVVFACNHCPYVIHILEAFSQLANASLKRGLAVVMINSNDVDNYPADSPEKMVLLAQQHSFKFPYLYDQSQQVALAYQAVCTPDLFLFDATHRLVYRGQFDDSRPGKVAVADGGDLASAIDAVIEGKPLQQEQQPSVGCSIKWKAQNQA